MQRMLHPLALKLALSMHSSLDATAWQLQQLPQILLQCKTSYDMSATSCCNIAN